MAQDYTKSNFATAFLFLNSEKRYALSLIYRFMRLADDAVDFRSSINEVNNLEEEINKIYSGKELQNDFFIKLKDVIKRYDIPRQVFSCLIEGIKKDSQGLNIKTRKELEYYMYCVAATAGICVLKISGFSGKHLEEIATKTGYAVQMTNILRDIKEDLKMRRVYLPEEERIRFLNTAELDIKNPGFRELFEFEKQTALSYYRESDELFKKNKSPSLLVASIMKNIYRELLKGLNFELSEKNRKISNYKRIKAVAKSFCEILL